MSDWLIFAAAIVAYVWAIRSHYRHTFPADPKHWRGESLSMSVRDGRIHYRRRPTTPAKGAASDV